MTVNIGSLDKAISNMPKYPLILDHEGQEYVSLIFIAALQEEQSTSKVLHANGTRLTKLTVTVYWRVVPANVVFLCQQLCWPIEVRAVR